MPSCFDSKLDDEAGRLLALHRLELLDTPDEPQFAAITALVRQVLKVPVCVVSLIDADRQWLKAADGFERGEMARDIAFCDHTIRGRGVLAVPDARDDPRFAANPLVTGEPFIRAYCGAPLASADGYNLGALCVVDHEPRHFSEAEQSLLQGFALLVVDQFELRTLAREDGLTGAMTYRAFVESMDAAVARTARDGAPATLMTFDLDHFKAINDRFGHPQGDEVLRRVAGVARNQLRLGDQFGRLGGEEFAILLNGTGTEDALFAADRLRRAIAALDLACGPVTASFGVAELIPDRSRWLAAADAALYEAKRGGRNCCVAAGGGARAETRAAA